MSKTHISVKFSWIIKIKGNLSSGVGMFVVVTLFSILLPDVVAILYYIQLEKGFKIINCSFKKLFTSNVEFSQV